MTDSNNRTKIDNLDIDNFADNCIGKEGYGSPMHIPEDGKSSDFSSSGQSSPIENNNPWDIFAQEGTTVADGDPGIPSSEINPIQSNAPWDNFAQGTSSTGLTGIDWSNNPAIPSTETQGQVQPSPMENNSVEQSGTQFPNSGDSADGMSTSTSEDSNDSDEEFIHHNDVSQESEGAYSQAYGAGENVDDLRSDESSSYNNYQYYGNTYGGVDYGWGSVMDYNSNDSVATQGPESSNQNVGGNENSYDDSGNDSDTEYQNHSGVSQESEGAYSNSYGRGENVDDLSGTEYQNHSGVSQESESSYSHSYGPGENVDDLRPAANTPSVSGLGDAFNNQASSNNSTQSSSPATPESSNDSTPRPGGM